MTDWQWTTPTGCRWFSCQPLLKTLNLFHDVMSTFFRARKASGRFLHHCYLCSSTYIWGLFHPGSGSQHISQIVYLLNPIFAFQICIGASNSSLKALTAVQSRKSWLKVVKLWFPLGLVTQGRGLDGNIMPQTYQEDISGEQNRVISWGQSKSEL
jgi:hypothetical protein